MHINQHLSFHITVNVSDPPSSLPPPRLPSCSPLLPSQCSSLGSNSNQQISTVTLMSEIAYEGNLFPMVGPMINAR